MSPVLPRLPVCDLCRLFSTREWPSFKQAPMVAKYSGQRAIKKWDGLSMHIQRSRSSCDARRGMHIFTPWYLNLGEASFWVQYVVVQDAATTARTKPKHHESITEIESFLQTPSRRNQHQTTWRAHVS